MKANIAIKGERSLWLNFTHEVKQSHKEVWEVLSPMLKAYIKKHRSHNQASRKD